ncbi:MAG: MoaD/ThiS family protein [Cyanobacteria bacterium HKST-UBA02]|nr:MoaD/ThiS family protein [Cyanobacteria bacterium HKST-UBA02]
MIVHIPSPLRSYTGNESRVEAHGSTVRDLLGDLESRHPGIVFRMIDEQDGIRKHIKIYRDNEPVSAIDESLDGAAVLHIICALSGG